MKITEPKTPYVRYNAETDEFEGGKPCPNFLLLPRSYIPASPVSMISDIPSLDLAGNNSGVSSPVLQSPVSAEQPPPSPPASPRRASFSSGVNGRSSSGRRSGSSSRSTSFSLPNEAKGEISQERLGPSDEEVEEEEEMDEEGKFQPHAHLSINADRSTFFPSRRKTRRICQSPREALFQRSPSYEGVTFCARRD